MSTDSSSKLFEKLKAFKIYSNDAIFFKYIFDESDLATAKATNGNESDIDDKALSAPFKAEYTHQIFGDEEIIFGYKALVIDYFLAPATLDAYIGLRYKEKISPQRWEGIEADDVYHSFSEFGCSPGFTRQLDTFRTRMLAADRQFQPYGTKIHDYTRADESSSQTFEIYRMDAACEAYTSEAFVDYILRVQTMLVYFIETSCFVDTSDPAWTYYLLYEKKKKNTMCGSENECEWRYATIGYVSVYNFYAYPDKTRSRISQVMIFPHYERAGHGAAMLEAVYRDVCREPRIADITAEDPSADFVRIRDYTTTKMCLTLASFGDKAALKRGFSAQMARDALATYKLPKLQSRRCYEILRMAATKPSDVDEWRAFRLDVKKVNLNNEILVVNMQFDLYYYLFVFVRLSKRLYLPFIRRSKYARNICGGASSSSSSSTSAEEPSGSSSAAASTSKSAEQAEKQVSLHQPRKATKRPMLASRFGSGSGREEAAAAAEDDDDEGFGVTTIGFGPSNGSKPSMSISNGNGSKRFAAATTTSVVAMQALAPAMSSSKMAPTTVVAKTTNGATKSVSFAVAKNTSLNTSNSTTDKSTSSHDGDDDDEDEDDEDGDENDENMGLGQQQDASPEKLFVTPEERKTYLEEQFQLIVADYNKILKRLEKDNISV